MKPIALLGFASFAVLIVGCGPLPPCEKVESLSRTSPDGLLKAAIVDVKCGATTDDATRIVITGAVSKFDYDQDIVAIFDGHVKGISWESSTLVVDYGDARPTTMTVLYKTVPIKYVGQSAKSTTH